MFSFVVNAVFVVIGSLLGLLFKKFIKKDTCDSVLKAIGLTVMLIGLIGFAEYVLPFNTSKTLPSTGTLAVIISIAIGTFIGESLKIDDGLNNFASKLEKKLNKGKIAEGFITATLVFCVGSMAIMGSFQSAFGDPNTIYLKTVLDFITSIVLASTLGIGVAFSSVAILIYQGSLTFLFKYVGFIFPDQMLNLINCVGYVLIVAIGVNFLITNKIKVANMLPALLIAVPSYWLMLWLQ